MCYGSYLILQNGKVHIPAGILALKRAQRGDDVAAIAAKDAQAAANAAQEANAKAADSRDNATQKTHPKASKCPEFRGDISYKDGQKLVHCKGCKQNSSYAGWADHCGKHHATVQYCIPQHSKMNGEANADDGDKDDDVVSEQAAAKCKGWR